MCGILAIFAYGSSAPPVCRKELLRTREAMIHRGPDGAGLWMSRDDRVGLAHRRLAIIDLSDGGAQPMATADGYFRITFNGEIYNYIELRHELEKKGFRFQSSSDTEVLLNLYADRGERMVDALRGMYAFAIWDERKRGLFLARDPFGIKPLYYADDGATLRIASQVKALLKGGAIEREPEPAGHVGFFLWGHVPEPYTLYKNIRALPAGASLWIDSDGRREIRQFFSVTDELAKASFARLRTSREETHERVRAALLDSVRHHMIADVPVGVFLSAGLDSSTITALARESAGSDLRSVTLGFREFQGRPEDEVPLAELVAKQYRTHHQTSWVTKADFREDHDHFLDAMDQPSIDGVNSYFVSKAAAQLGIKVALSGLGGDEMFGGYPSFKQIPMTVSALSHFAEIPGLGRGFRALAAPLLKHFTSPKYAGLLEYGGTYGGAYLLRRGMFMPWELPELLDGEMVREGWNELQTLSRLKDTTQGVNSPHLKVEALETSWYMRNQLLRDADWASMAHSLEIRLPLVDIGLFRATAPFFNSDNMAGKAVMAGAPLDPLPRAVMKRSKTGFMIPRDWMVPEGATSIAHRGLRGRASTIYSRFAGAGLGAPDETRPVALVYRTGQLGDTLVALPAMEAIRRKFPNHRLVLLTDRQSGRSGYVSSWDLCGPTGWFERVIYYDPKVRGLGALRQWASLLIRLRRLKVDQFFNLAPGRTARQAIRDAWLFKGVVLPQTYHPPAVLRSPTPGLHRPLAWVEPEWRHTLRSVGAPELERQEFRLQIPGCEREKAFLAARIDGIDLNAGLLAFGPGSKMPAKRWLAERYAELGMRIRKEFPEMQFVVLGGTEDMEIGRNLCSKWGAAAYNLAGKTSVYGSAAVLEKCIAYVGNDTGTMHLAAMCGTPCVAIFSARDSPGRWDPYGQRHIVLRRETDCAGCLLETCSQYKNECLRRISVEDVYGATKTLLQEKVAIRRR